MKIQPHGEYVTLRPEEDAPSSSLVLPEIARQPGHGAEQSLQPYAVGTVLAVGHGPRTGTEYPLGHEDLDLTEPYFGARFEIVDVSPGDRVLYERATATRISAEGEPVVVVSRYAAIEAVLSPDAQVDVLTTTRSTGA